MSFAETVLQEPYDDASQDRKNQIGRDATNLKAI